MVDNRRSSGASFGNAMGGYPPYGMPQGQGMMQNQGMMQRQDANQSSSGKNNKKKKNLTPAQKAMMIQNRTALMARQERAIQNSNYRRKIEAINESKGGLDRTFYKLAEDRKPRKEKDYFYIMRKGICFIMFLFIVVSVALFVLSYLKLAVIPDQYLSLFITTDIPEGGVATITSKYSVLDPVFGFIKNISGKFLDSGISLGDSPLYDEMLAKSEGMTDKIAGIALEYFPVAIILYAITALIMMIKSFLGMFGRRIFKKFGLGSFIMIICAAITAFGGLAYVTELNATMAYANIVNILIGGVLAKGGFTSGYGLLAMVGLPVLVLLFSMFTRKRIPYSIFDN